MASRLRKRRRASRARGHLAAYRREANTRKYVIRAVVFQEDEWLCAQCLEYGPHGAGQKPEAALSGSTKDHRGPHCDPTPLPPAAIPRPSSAIPTGASSANVQAPDTEVAWNRCRTAPGSRRDRKRCVVRGSSLLRDAYSGRAHYPRSTLRVHEAHHSYPRGRRAPRLSPAWNWRLAEPRGAVAYT